MKSVPMILISLILLASSASAVSWIAHDITTYYPDVEIASVADIDMDGDKDILAIGQQAGPITWWENEDGQGQSWVRHEVNDEIDGVYSIWGVDLDNDGDNDVVCDSRILNKVVWFENLNGDGLNWEQHFVDEDIDNPRWLVISDLDQDADQDILGTAYGLGIIYWWDNDGTGAFNRHLIDDVGDELNDNPNGFSVGDIDLDGDLDVFATISSRALYWYENDGAQGFTRNVIEDISHPVYDVAAADVDLDGDLDAFAAKAGLRWFENVDGTGNTWINHEIAINEGYQNLAVYDVDGDSFPDVITRTISQMLYFNNPGTGDQWRQVAVTPPFTDAGRFDSGDIDADGDLDLAVPLRDDNDLVWLEMVFLRPQQPIDLEVNRLDDGMLLAWSAAPGEDPEFINYRIYRDGFLIATSLELEYVDSSEEYGLHDWNVTAMYSDGESELLDPITELYPDPLKLELDETFDDGLPLTWSIEFTVATVTWHIDDGSEHAYYPTPYMLMDAAPGSQLNDYFERLITPEIDVSDAQQVLLLFDQTSWNNGENHLVQWSNDGGESWDTIIEYPDDIITNEILDISDRVQNESSILISWYFYDVNNNYSRGRWGVDDVTFYVDRDTAPVRLNLDPTVNEVPEEGGEIEFDVHLISALDSPQPSVAIWRSLRLPNGQDIQFAPDFRFTLPAYADLHVVGATQTIPAIAPAGTYQFTLSAGFVNHPQLQVQDSFQFSKLGVLRSADLDVNAADWPLTMAFPPAATDLGNQILPTSWSLGKPFPNPFNASTTIELTLPRSSQISVALFNVLGQHVLDIADSHLSAGRHTLSIDGSTLPSGMYFVKAVNERDQQISKLMLLK